MDRLFSHIINNKQLTEEGFIFKTRSGHREFHICSNLQNEVELCYEPDLNLEPTECYPGWYLELTTSCDLSEEEEIHLEEYLDALAVGRDYTPVTLVTKLPSVLVKWLVNNNQTTNFLIPKREPPCSSSDQPSSSVDSEDLESAMYHKSLEAQLHEERKIVQSEPDVIRELDKKLLSTEREEYPEEEACEQQAISSMMKQAEKHLSEVKKVLREPFSMTTAQNIHFSIPSTTNENLKQQYHSAIAKSEEIGNQILTSNVLLTMNELIGTIVQPPHLERRRVQNLIHHHLKFVKWLNKQLRAVINLKEPKLKISSIGDFLRFISDLKEKGNYRVSELVDKYQLIPDAKHIAPGLNIELIPFNSSKTFTWTYISSSESYTTTINYKALKRFKIETEVLRSKSGSGSIHITLKKTIRVNFES